MRVGMIPCGGGRACAALLPMICGPPLSEAGILTAGACLPCGWV